MSEPSNTQQDEGSWINKEALIGAAIGAIFGGAIEHIFINQGATIVAALLFGVAAFFAPLLFK